MFHAVMCWILTHPPPVALEDTTAIVTFQTVLPRLTMLNDAERGNVRVSAGVPSCFMSLPTGTGVSVTYGPVVVGPFLDRAVGWFDAKYVEPSVEHEVAHDWLGGDHCVDRGAWCLDEYRQAERAVAQGLTVVERLDRQPDAQIATVALERPNVASETLWSTLLPLPYRPLSTVDALYCRLIQFVTTIGAVMISVSTARSGSRDQS